MVLKAKSDIAFRVKMDELSKKDNFNIDESKVSVRKWKTSFNESSPLMKSTTSIEFSLQIKSFIHSGKELKRSLGFKHAFVFIVGILFGSGIFVSPGLVAKETNNMGMAIIVWVISGIPCLFGALCFCELSCMYGKAGGEYIYISEAYGKVVGFFSMWTQILLVIPLVMAILVLAIGEHVVEPFCDITSNSGIWLTKAIALVAMLISTIINCVSTSFVGKLQMWFTGIQTLTVVFLVVLGVWQVSIGHTDNYINMFKSTSKFDIGSFGIALYNGLWGYDGWGLIASVTEEIENVEKNLWLAIITGIPFVIVCYVLINLALMSALSREQMAKSSTVATTFVENIFGKKVALIMPFAVSFCCFGSVNATLFVLSRVLLSAAREGHLPYFVSFIHKNRRTPIPAVIAFFILTAIWLVIPGIDMQSLIAFFSFAVWLQYGLAIFSVIVMRIRKPDMPRPFKVWIANPVFTSIVALFLVVIPFVKKPVESSISLAISLSAFPVYYIFIIKHDSLPSCLHNVMDRFNEFLKVKCNLVPCIFVENNVDTDDSNYNKL